MSLFVIKGEKIVHTRDILNDHKVRKRPDMYNLNLHKLRCRAWQEQNREGEEDGGGVDEKMQYLM